MTARDRGNIIRAVSVEIRDFEKPSDYEACAQLQVDVWGFSAADAVPPLHLIAMHHYGGILVGAFEAERMVGFVCGFSGWDRGRVFHHSHMMGVHEKYRGSGLGDKLKWAQRDRVLAQGIDLVNWTFDPLQAVNANLNVNQLAALVRKYRVNIYGESKSKLHGSLPTDRFEAENANANLSEERAKSVASYLASKGMDQKLMFWEGKGAKEPVPVTKFCE